MLKLDDINEKVYFEFRRSQMEALKTERLGQIHKKIKNPINIICSDGKYSTLKSLQFIIEQNI